LIYFLLLLAIDLFADDRSHPCCRSIYHLLLLLLSIDLSLAVDRSVCCRSIYHLLLLLLSILLLQLLLSISLAVAAAPAAVAIDRSLCCQSIYLLLLPVLLLPIYLTLAAAVDRSSSSGYAVDRRIVCCQFLYQSSYFLLLSRSINSFTDDMPSIDLSPLTIIIMTCTS
jgi:hypothetical protein